MAARGVLSVLKATFVEAWRWMRAPQHRRSAIALALLAAGNVSYAVFRAVYLTSCDLIHGYLIPARAILIQRQDPYVDFAFNSFSPFFYIVIAPLALVPDWMASLVWTLLSLGFLIGVVGVTGAIIEKTLTPRRPVGRWWGPLLGVTLITDNLYLGQSNLFALFFVCCALYALLVGHDLRAGLLLGVAIAWKLTPALFLFYFAVKRRVLALLGAGLALALCLLAAPSLVLGPARNTHLLKEWSAAVVEPFLSGARVLSTNINWYHTNQSLEAFLNRHFTSYGRETYRGLHVLLDPAFWMEAETRRPALAVKLLLLGVIALAALRSRQVATRNFPFEVSLTLMATLFISPVSWYSHYVVVLVPYQLVVQELAIRPRSSGGFKLLAVTLAIAAAITTASLSSTLRSYSLVFLAQFAFFCALAVYTLRHSPRGCAVPDCSP